MATRSTVAIERCGSYDGQTVRAALDAAISHLGGIGRYVRGGARVLIKPNLLSVRAPEAGVTTHPELVRALIRIVRTRTNDIMIGDTPGGAGKNIRQVWESTGMRRVAEEEGVRLVILDAPRLVKGIPFSAEALAADHIISVPKFKSHSNTVITGAVKNMYGIVPGLYKAQLHREFPGAVEFSGKLVEIFALRPPDLTVVDAVEIMEGNGPAYGTLRTLGLILSGTDAVSVDAVMTAVIGRKSFFVPSTRIAHERGVGIGDLTQIDVRGERIETVRITDFKVAPTARFYLSAPRWVLKGLGRLIWFRPDIDRARCTACGLCQTICPVGAIAAKAGTIDHRRCILCLCCQEVCPHRGIRLSMSLLARALFGKTIAEGPARTQDRCHGSRASGHER